MSLYPVGQMYDSAILHAEFLHAEFLLSKTIVFCLVPDVEVKGEYSSYYLLLQGDDSRKCKATLIHSANQINGSFALSLIHGKMKARTEDTMLSKC